MRVSGLRESQTSKERLSSHRLYADDCRRLHVGLQKAMLLLPLSPGSVTWLSVLGGLGKFTERPWSSGTLHLAHSRCRDFTEPLSETEEDLGFERADSLEMLVAIGEYWRICRKMLIGQRKNASILR